ncbi:hypothetical protein PHAVU_003G146450 [Phaseolus vulgaris]
MGPNPLGWELDLESEAVGVQCLRYTTRLFKGFFFPFTLMWKFLFSTLVLPQMDGWMADHHLKCYQNAPFPYLSLQFHKQLCWKGNDLQLVAPMSTTTMG